MLEYAFDDGFEITVEKKNEKGKFLLVVKQFKYGVLKKHWRMSFSQSVRDAFYKQHESKDYVKEEYLF